MDLVGNVTPPQHKEVICERYQEIVHGKTNSYDRENIEIQSITIGDNLLPRMSTDNVDKVSNFRAFRTKVFTKKYKRIFTT